MTDDELAAWVDAAARGMGIDIPPEHRAAVLMNFARIGSMAALVNALELDESLEPAPVFRLD